jgi:hypothetical protein
MSGTALRRTLLFQRLEFSSAQILALSEPLAAPYVPLTD